VAARSTSSDRSSLTSTTGGIAAPGRRVNFVVLATTALSPI
jgi:hypothetical protein